MSLINDALKRASQAEKNLPRDPGLPSAMQPTRESRRSFAPMLAGVAVAGLLAAAGWFAWRALPHRDKPAPPPAVLTAVGPATAEGPAKTEASAKTSRRDAAATFNPAPPARMEPPPAVLSAAGPAKAEALAKEGASVPAPAPAPAPVAVTPPPNTNPPAPDIGTAPLPSAASAKESALPPFPELKLQGIFYSRNNPRAAINGEIRGEKELIGEVRIVAITPNKVTVEWNGQTRDLNLGGQ